MKKNYQEHELTAFLLDELDDKRRDEIAEILKDSGSARQELEELRETMQGLCEAMAVEPAMTLSAEQREEIQAEFAKPQNLAPVSRPSSRTRFVRWAVPLAAAASLFVVFLLSWNVVVNRESLPHPTEQAAKLQQSELDKAQSLPKTADLAAGARESDPPARITDSKEEQSTPIGNEKAREKRAISDAVLAYKSAAVPSFKGKVTDSAGAPLPGAAVQVASDAAKPVESTLTDTRGQFAVPPLPEGAYTVRAALPGFKPSQVGPVNVEDGQTRQVQLALQAGGDGTIGALKEFSESARTSQEKLRSMSPTSPEQLRSMSPAPAKDPRGVSETFHLDGASGGGAGVIDRSKGEARFRIVPRSGIAPEEESFNTESYTYQADNEMTAVAKDPLSTFSIDVDTASYSNVRRFLREGRLPPPDAVRIEEMINYFPYDYEPPHDRSPFAVVTEVAQAPWALDHRLVRIALKGRELPPTERPDANLVFLLDVSGSMQPGVKLPLVKQAMRLLVEKLESSDRVAIVTYAGTSGLALPSTSGSNKERILNAIDQLEAGGSTNGASGIQLAYREVLANFRANGINRVILATDGDFNVGMTNQGELVRLVQQQAAKGVYLTALGFGMSNYKDSMLETLADKGNGNYAYIDSLDEARKVLVEQMGGTLVTIAKDVKIQVEFNPLEVSAYRLIGYENRVLAHQDFDDDRKDAGEIGAGHTVTALYEVVPVGVPVDLPQGEPLKYQRKSPAAAARGELLTVNLRYKLPNEGTSRKIDVPVIDSMRVFDQASDDFRFATAVAGFGMILRNSPFKGSATFQSMMQIADTSRQFDPQGYRAEFVRLVGEASRLAGRE